MNPLEPSRRSADVRQWLADRVAREVGIESRDVDVQRPFAFYGFDSMSVITAVGELEQWLGRSIDPSILWDFSTIAAFADHVAANTAKTATEPAASPRGPAGAAHSPIAIVGIGCRLPGNVEGPRAFWELLRTGRDAITEVPADRWDVEEFHDSRPGTPGRTYSRWGGFIERVDEYDAKFFGHSRREAERLDPQHRILLETAWETFEDCGRPPADFAGKRVGVFIGIGGSEYGARQLRDMSTLDAYFATGNAGSMAANRISHFFDLRSQSLAVDTACSSSLVAIDLACRSLWSGQTNWALGGGVSLMLSPAVTIAFSHGHALSVDGRCRSFDARANGIVRGEGVGLVLLRPLEDALRDGDRVYACVLGSAVNQDGRTQEITAPSRSAQAAVLADAYRAAGINPAHVTYVETHGTATLLGDPVEAAALGDVLRPERPDDQPCLIGSVKSNLGHLEAAAGVVGLIKTALALHHQEIPESLHFVEPNPFIPFEALGLQVQRSGTAWPDRGVRRVAGVSGFGFGGTNAHVVMAEAPAPPARNGAETFPSAFILPVSATSDRGLERQCVAYREHLTNAIGSPGALAALCHSAGVRRTHHRVRRAIVGRAADEMLAAAEGLTTFDAESQPRRRSSVAVEAPAVVAVFPGLGGSITTVDRICLEEWPAFRRAVQACDERITELIGWSPSARVMNQDPSTAPIDVRQLSHFVLQMGLWSVWRSWGVAPAAVIGHSGGEVVAACAAGALDFEQAVVLACARARASRVAVESVGDLGAMIGAKFSAHAVGQFIDDFGDRVCVAVDNAPDSIVLSGHRDALAVVMSRLEQARVGAKWLDVEGAGHSPLMQPAAASIARELGGLRPAAASVQFFSTVEGGLTAGETLGATYWMRNLQEPVRFREALDAVIDAGHSVFLELGSHALLTPLIARALRARKTRGAALSSLQQGTAGNLTLLRALGKLYEHGATIDWSGVYPDPQPFASMPLHSWDRESFWLDIVKNVGAEAVTASTPTRALPDEPESAVYDLKWHAAERVMTMHGNFAHTRWLLIGGDPGRVAAARAVLERLGVVTVTAHCGSPDSPLDDIDQLFRRGEGEAGFTHVAYLWSGERLSATWDGQRMQTAAALEWTRVVRTAQVLAGQPHASLHLFTYGAVAVDGVMSLDGLSQAVLWGLGRTLRLEHPSLSCTLTDVSADGSPEEITASCREILHQHHSGQAAFRGGQMYVATIAPRRIEDAGPLAGAASVVHGDDAYVVTGGLGALGLNVAEWLVARGAKVVFLLGRRGPTDADAARIERLQRTGARIASIAVDVADAALLAAALDECRASGRLAGIVHAAGVIDDAALESQDAAHFARAAAPKVAGAWNLHRATIDDRLDWFVLFSSASAMLGSPTQANYAAANAFLDGLAYYRRSLGLPSLSVNWGPWQSGAAPGSRREVFQLREQLSTEHALHALEQMIALGTTNAMVAQLDWAKWRRIYAADANGPFLGTLRLESPGDRARGWAGDEVMALDADARDERLVAYLRQAIGRVLSVSADEIAPGEPLNRVGLDSLMAVELSNTIDRDLGVTPTAAALLRGDTVINVASAMLVLLTEGRGQTLAPHSRPEAALASLDSLSDAEVESMLRDLQER